MGLGSFADEVRGSKNWERARERMAKVIRRDPFEALRIAEALTADLERNGPDLAVGALLHGSFDLACAHPDPQATTVAVELQLRASAPPDVDQPPWRGRELGAQKIAAMRPGKQVAALLAGDLLKASDPDLGLLLAHELLLRSSGTWTQGAWYEAWAREAGHPLARLPLRLLDIEQDLPPLLPSIHESGSSWHIVDGLPQDPAPLSTWLAGLGSPVLLDEAAAVMPFEDWCTASNGEARAAAYSLGTSFPEAMPEPSLRPDTPAGELEAVEAVTLLFSSAMNAGAYSNGAGAARARLWTWTGLTAMVGAARGTPIDDVAQRVEHGRWLTLDVRSNAWFADVAWDCWLLHADGERVATVAATDTD